MKMMWRIFYFAVPAVMTAAFFLCPAAQALSGAKQTGMILGIWAYWMLCAQLILTARIPAVERAFGQDKLLRFHGAAALIAVVISIAHAFFMHRGWFTPRFRYGEVSLVLFIVLIALALYFLSDLITDRSRAAAKLRKKLYAWKLTRYNTQLVLHDLTAAAVALLPFHAEARLKFFWDAPLFAALIFLCAAVSLGCFLWHVFLRKPYLYRVREVIRDNSTMTTVILAPEMSRVMPRLAGQFAYIKAEDPAVPGEYHAITASSAPDEPLAFTIKALGDWSEKVGDIRPGSLVKADGPYGRFCPALYPETPLVLIAGGVGITPMMSIVRSLYHRDSPRRVLLLWCVRERSELIDWDEWERMEKEMAGLTIVPVLSREKAAGCAHGHFSESILREALEKSGISPDEASFWYCGPGPLRASVHGVMKALGVPEGRFHEERFSL